MTPRGFGLRTARICVGHGRSFAYWRKVNLPRLLKHSHLPSLKTCQPTSLPSVAWHNSGRSVTIIVGPRLAQQALPRDISQLCIRAASYLLRQTCYDPPRPRVVVFAAVIIDGQVPCSGCCGQRVRLETEQPTCTIRVPWIAWPSMIIAQ